LTESEIVFQKFEVWNQYGLKATHTRKERKRVKLATFILTFLIFGSLAFLMPTVQTQDPPPPPTPVPVNQTVPLEGNMTFTFYPDGSIKMTVIGSLEQAMETDFPPPVYDVYFNLAKSPSGVNLTKTKGIIVMKLSPMYSTLLAALELNIEAHGEGLRSNATILFNMPGYLGVNGTLGSVTDESTGEGIQDFALTATIWYPIVPKEEIQEFIQTFPTLKSQIATQISELSEGNITLQELTLVSREIDYYSTSLTITGCLVGDFVEGGMALSTNLIPLLGINDTQTAPYLSPEELMNMKTKSADIHIRFDRNELAFLMDSESVVEGDMDKLINVMMDTWLEEYLQDLYLDLYLKDPYLIIDPETELMINDVLIPTDISTENLNVSFEYSFDGENIKLDFAVEGLVFRPPTTEAFLTILDKALAGGSVPGFSLIFEGGSDEEGFVEIEVPPTTSEPIMAFPLRVVWIVDNLANLNLVSFKVREGPPPPPPLPPILDNLTITSKEIEVEEGEIFIVSFDITNIDSQSINYGVDIHIENVNDPPPTWPPYDVTLRIWVELGAYESKTVSHTIIMDTCGDFHVTVHGMTGSFKVGTWPPEPLKPAELVLSDLSITPETAQLWGDIEVWNFKITADVTNIGEQKGMDTYTVEVDGLTGNFTVKAPPKPAEFEFSDLRIFYPGVIPPEVKKDETVTVTVSIEAENVGELMGSHIVELKVDGYVVDSQEVTLEGGASVCVLLELTRGEGTYDVEVEGMTDGFTVSALPEPPFWTRPGNVAVILIIIISVSGMIYILRKRQVVTEEV